MATRERLEQALRNAHAAGDTESARRLAAAIRNGEYEQPQQQEQRGIGERIAGALNDYGNRATGIGEAALSVGSSALAEPLAGLAGIASMPFRGAQAGDTVETVRNALTYEPRTAPGQQTMQSVGEFLQPAGEALQSVEQGLGDAAYSATGSPALAAGATALPTAALELIGAGLGGRASRNSARQAAVNQIPQDLESRAVADLRALENSGAVDTSYNSVMRNTENAVPAGDATVISPEQAQRNMERRAAFNRFDIEPTEAQHTRDRQLFMDQQERNKAGGVVSQRLEEQDAAIMSRTNDTVRATGGDPTLAPTSPIDYITNRSLAADREISDLYRAAREAAPDAKNVRFDSASSVLRQFAPDNELSGGVIASLRGVLNQSGAVDGFRPSGRVSIEAAERVRQHANEIFASTNDRGKMIIRQFKDALDEDVGRAAGQDFFQQARQAKHSFERGLDRDKFHKFDERNVNIVRDMLNNKLTPDEIQNGALIRAGSKYKAQDLRELKDYLTASGDDAGMAAWRDIKASAMQHIADNIFTGAVGEGGVQSLSRAKLSQAVKGIGAQKYDVLFDASEKKFLRDLTEIAKWREPPAGTLMGRGPSAQAISSAAQQIDDKITSLFGGVRFPLVSNLLEGRRAANTEKTLLNLNDSLYQVERQRIMDDLNLSKKATRDGRFKGAGSAAVIPGLTGSDDEENN